MGQKTTKRCLTQEVTFEPLANEWRATDQRTEVLDVITGPGESCESVPPSCRTCCAPVEGQITLEEVLVVRHEALQKIDFLLRDDEIEDCSGPPAIPECVTAVRRARIQKRRASGGTADIFGVEVPAGVVSS
eukprot:gnl/TRDRNA2_/TRDRNA2_193082_c0_seq1.p1 gnl/TRDRNA2_/TRDRNA2_193082_c0~~gnl/TRDRNA2_/TRDRNA2_193082_c0_seq1.p1  ORF type:complete len:132 (-),score=16.02 gnl/TRDRNA2_/TRDRNA2_193082_c0_seq1:52-447(-)